MCCQHTTAHLNTSQTKQRRSTIASRQNSKEGHQKLADADRRKLGPYIQLVLEAHVEAKHEGKRPKTRS
jgi:hypothetical protein